MNILPKYYVEATKKLLPHLDAIKGANPPQLKEFARTAIRETLKVDEVDEDSELFKQILERVNAIYNQAVNPIDKEMQTRLIKIFDDYDVNNNNNLNENLKAIMMESRKKNVQKKFNTEKFVSCLTSDELGILNNLKVESPDKSPVKIYSFGGKKSKKYRKNSKKSKKYNKKSKKSRMGRFPHKKSKNKRR